MTPSPEKRLTGLSAHTCGRSRESVPFNPGMGCMPWSKGRDLLLSNLGHRQQQHTGYPPSTPVSRVTRQYFPIVGEPLFASSVDGQKRGEGGEESEGEELGAIHLGLPPLSLWPNPESTSCSSAESLPVEDPPESGGCHWPLTQFHLCLMGT